MKKKSGRFNISRELKHYHKFRITLVPIVIALLLPFTLSSFDLCRWKITRFSFFFFFFSSSSSSSVVSIPSCTCCAIIIIIIVVVMIIISTRCTWIFFFFLIFSANSFFGLLESSQRPGFHISIPSIFVLARFFDSDGVLKKKWNIKKIFFLFFKRALYHLKIHREFILDPPTNESCV